jgi:hypothetical protein
MVLRVVSFLAHFPVYFASQSQGASCPLKASEASDAFSDLVFITCGYLISPLGICDEGTAQGDHIRFSFFDSVLSILRIMETGCNDGNSEGLFHEFGFGEHGAVFFGHIPFYGFPAA